MGDNRQNSELALINATDIPVTRTSIADELRTIGVQSGDLILMHTALSKLGWVCGGEQAVLEAVFDVLGNSGTLVMPGFSSQLSDPAGWNSPPVPQDWIKPVRDNMPVFDKHLTPTRGMGRVAEAFRKLPDTIRSDHPVDSFLANGPLSDDILADQPLENSLGQNSTLGKLYDQGAKILLLGADYGSCSAFHLAEDGLPDVALETVTFPTIRRDGVTRWVTIQRPPTFEELFPQIGAELDELLGKVSHGFNGVARLFDMQVGVDLAHNWFVQNSPQ